MQTTQRANKPDRYAENETITQRQTLKISTLKREKYLYLLIFNHIKVN